MKPELMTEKVKNSIAMLEKTISQAEKILENFKHKLAVDPYHAFEWSSGAFEAVALLHVYKPVLTVLKDPKSPSTPAYLREYAIKEVLSRSSFVSDGGTIPKQLSRETLAAWAKLMDSLSGPLSVLNIGE